VNSEEAQGCEGRWRRARSWGVVYTLAISGLDKCLLAFYGGVMTRGNGLKAVLTGIGLLALAVFAGCSAGRQGEAESAEGSSNGVRNASYNMRPAPGAMVVLAPVPLVLPVADAIGGNLLRNGDFEMNAMGSGDEEPPRPLLWDFTAANSGSAWSDRDQHAFGRHSLRVELPAHAPFEAFQQVQAQGHSRYISRCLVLTRGLSGSVQLAVEGLAKGKKCFASDSEGLEEAGNAWRLLELAFDLPAFADAMRVELRCLPAGRAGEAAGIVWFDQCELYCVQMPANLLKNGDFSEGPTGLNHWHNRENMQVAASPSGLGPNAPTCIKVDLAGNDNVGIRQVVGDLEPGADYIVRGYIKTEDLVGDARIEVQHAEKGWRAFCQWTEGVAGTQDWTWASLRFAVPADASAVAVLLRHPGDAKASTKVGTARFAKVELFPAAAIE
jgi:hypothetical protein